MFSVVAVENPHNFDKERAHLLSIFPEEIWMLIFKETRDPQTLHNFAEASPAFRNMLHSHRIFYFFPTVLKIMDEQSYLKYRVPNERVNLLTCRSVCSSWKIAIDKFLETRPYHTKGQYPHVEGPNRNIYDAVKDPAVQAYFPLRKFRNNQIISEIIPKMISPYYQTNCVSPSRHIDIIGPKMTRRKMATIENFLEKAGGQFWHLNMESSNCVNPDMRPKLLEWFNVIKRFVKLMPNLKSLYILCPATKQEELELLELKNEILSSVLPFPTLKHLQVLSIFNQPKCAFEAILNANPHIKHVGFNFSARFYGNIAKECLIKNLKSPESVSYFILNGKEFQEIPTDWSLKNLRLNFKYCSDLKWDYIFQRLECFHESLTELSLKLNYLSNWQTIVNFLAYESTSRDLDLPMLQKLYIRFAYLGSIDFLLGLKALKHLTLELQVGQYKDYYAKFVCNKNPTIDFKVENAHQFMDCNIWKLLPNLSYVKIIICTDIGKGEVTSEHTFRKN